MIEKITVSGTEVLHCEWLNHTKVDIKYMDNAITRAPMFMQTVKLLLEKAIKHIGSVKVEVNCRGYDSTYLTFSFGTNDIMDLALRACDLILTCDANFPESPKEMGVFYANNRADINLFFEGMKRILSDKDDKNYKYDCRCVDGMN